jgi:hypothetical protein
MSKEAAPVPPPEEFPQGIEGQFQNIRDKTSLEDPLAAVRDAMPPAPQEFQYAPSAVSPTPDIAAAPQAEVAVVAATEPPVEAGSEVKRPMTKERITEAREYFKKLESARDAAVLAERRLSPAEIARVMKRLRDPRGETADLEGLRKEERGYYSALKTYEEGRAGYVGVKASRMMNESRRLAEANAKANESRPGFYEGIRSVWRKLGDANLASWYEGQTGKQIESKAWQRISRGLSLRTAANLGLLAGGVWLAAPGSVLGISAIFARRALGGMGTSFSVADLVRGYRERKATAIETSKLGEMSTPNLEQKMAEFEALAKFSGKRVVRSQGYLALRGEYAKRLRGDAELKIGEKAQALGDVLRKEQQAAVTRERQNKLIGFGAGITSTFGLSAAWRAWGATEAMQGAGGGSVPEKILEAKKALVGSASPEDAAKLIEKAPALTAEQATETVGRETKLPEGVIEAARRRAEGLGKFAGVTEAASRRAAGMARLAQESAGETSNPVEAAARRAEGLARLAREAAEPASDPIEAAARRAAGLGKLGPEAVGAVESPFKTDFEIPKPSLTGEHVPRRFGFDSEFSKPSAFEETARLRLSGELGGGGELPRATFTGLRETWEGGQAEKLAGTVKKGGSAWRAAKSLVGHGITNEEFRAAWSNPASVVKLPSGEEIHISELGLTHEGDAVAYVPAGAGAPAHFEVADPVKDEFHLGSNEELAEAMRSEDIKTPKWLDEAIAAKGEGIVEGVVPAAEIGSNAVAEEIAQKIPPSHDAAAQAYAEAAAERGQAAQAVGTEGAAEMSASTVVETSGESTRFAWGTARFEMDASGNVESMIFRETMSPAERAQFVERAAREVLREGFEEIVQDQTRETLVQYLHGEPLSALQEEELSELVLPRVKGAAAKVFEHQQLLESLPQDSAEAKHVSHMMSMLRKQYEFSYGKIFK